MISSGMMRSAIRRLDMHPRKRIHVRCDFCRLASFCTSGVRGHADLFGDSGEQAAGDLGACPQCHAPGKYRLRLGVVDMSNGRIGTLDVPFTVKATGSTPKATAE
jgi:hypothetical protein